MGLKSKTDRKGEHPFRPSHCLLADSKTVKINTSIPTWIVTFHSNPLVLIMLATKYLIW